MLRNYRLIIKVSVLFNEPKLLKFARSVSSSAFAICFSALQRAEIAEIVGLSKKLHIPVAVSVLFNEPKLLKFGLLLSAGVRSVGFSALQRAEIAEIRTFSDNNFALTRFQCSSTSRNC